MTPESKEVLEAVIRAAAKSVYPIPDYANHEGRAMLILDAMDFIQALKEEINKCVLCGEQKHICQHENGFDEEKK